MASRSQDCEIYADHVVVGPCRTFSTGVPARMDRQGDLLVVANGFDGYPYLEDHFDGIDLFSLADPDAPVLLGSADLYMPRDVKFSGSLVYALRSAHYSMPARFIVLDVGDPQSPQFLPGGVDLPGDARRLGLDSSGNRALVTCDSGHLLVLDTGNPTNPQLLGSVLLPAPLHDVAAGWGYAFASGEDGKLYVVDLGDPAAPALVNTVVLGDLFTEVAVEGDHVYTLGSGLKIFLWQGSGQLQFQGGLPSGTYSGLVHDAQVLGGVAAVCSDLGLYLEDVSLDTAPQRLLELSLTLGNYATTRCLALREEDCTLVLGNIEGIDAPPMHWPLSTVQCIRFGDLHAADVPWTAPVSPTDLCPGTEPGQHFAVDMQRLVELDLSDPAAATIVNEMALEGALVLAVDGALACVGLHPPGAQGLALIDLDTWQTLSLVPFTGSAYAYGCALRDGIAYIAAGYGGFRIYDVTDTSAPVLIRSFGHFADSVDLHGDTAFVFSQGNLYAYDVSDPYAIPNATPSALHGQSFELHGDVGYALYNGTPGVTELTAYDLSDPSAPAPTDSLRLLGGVGTSLAMRETWGLLEALSAGALYLLDLSTPTSPKVAGTLFGSYGRVWMADNCLMTFENWDGPLRLGPPPCRPTGLPDTPPSAARRLLLPHPNPFNPQVTLTLRMPAAGSASLSIHDVTGRRVCRLLNGTLPAGERRVEWDGRDERGGPVASGVYFARLEGEGSAESVKLVLLR